MPEPKRRTSSKASSSKASRRAASRFPALLRFDRALMAEQGKHCHLIGLDEVGRGSLIGPVVGGAACLPEKLTPSQRKLLARLDDSKRLTAPVRAKLSEALHEFCHVGIGIAEKDEVERLNVHQASLLALHRAFLALCDTAFPCATEGNCFLVMDGRSVMPHLPRERQRAIIKGDGQSAAIAAASVVAKHYRDTLVIALSNDFPGYGWQENMGYGVPAHLEAIRRLGATPHHRQSFKPVQMQISLPLV